MYPPTSSASTVPTFCGGLPVDGHNDIGVVDRLRRVRLIPGSASSQDVGKAAGAIFKAVSRVPVDHCSREFPRRLTNQIVVESLPVKAPGASPPPAAQAHLAPNI